LGESASARAGQPWLQTTEIARKVSRETGGSPGGGSGPAQSAWDAVVPPQPAGGL